MAVTPRQRRALDALCFYDDWTTPADVMRFVRDNGPAHLLTGQRPIIGWENTLRSLEARGLAEGRSFPNRYRILEAGRAA